MTLFVVLGALTTIGVAWGLAIRGVSYQVLPFDYTKWVLLKMKADSCVLLLATPVKTFGFTAFITRLEPPADDASRDRTPLEKLKTVTVASWLPQESSDRYALRSTGELESTEKCYSVISEVPDLRHCNDIVHRTGDYVTRDEWHIGWPLRCLWSFQETLGGGGGGDVFEIREAQHGWKLRAGKDWSFRPYVDTQWQGTWFVPTGILPLGFAINTAIYALAWSPLVFIPGALIRRSRRKHNRCIHCAYDLRATPTGKPCPECGNLA